MVVVKEFRGLGPASSELQAKKVHFGAGGPQRLQESHLTPGSSSGEGLEAWGLQDLVCGGREGV